jgi:hypothetical protein
MQFENSISIQKLADLPEISAIYAVISQSQGILYIGQSKHLRSRWQRHHRLEQVQTIDPTASLSWFPCDLELLNQTEYSLIQEHQPLLNGSPVLDAKRISPEKVLQNTLVQLAPYIAVFGMDRQESPATIVIKYFGVLGAGIASRLRTILEGKWVEFVKRKDASWWRCKCNGFRLELGPWLYEDTPTRTAMNSDMSRVLNEKYFPGQKSIDYEEWKSIHKQKRTLEENLEIIRTTSEGSKLFPLQAHAVLGKLATVQVLTLTQGQLSQISLDLESLATQDPITFLAR